MQVDEYIMNPETAERLVEAIEAGDKNAISVLLDPLPVSEALREILNLKLAQRDAALDMMPLDLAAELAEEAPSEMAALLLEHMSAERAADVIEMLDTNIQADVIGDMDQSQAGGYPD